MSRDKYCRWTLSVKVTRIHGLCWTRLTVVRKDGHPKMSMTPTFAHRVKARVRCKIARLCQPLGNKRRRVWETWVVNVARRFHLVYKYPWFSCADEGWTPPWETFDLGVARGENLAMWARQETRFFTRLARTHEKGCNIVSPSTE